VLEWWLEPPVVLRELLHVHVDDLVEQREGVHLPSRRPAVHLRTKCRLTNTSTLTAAMNAMRAPVTLRSQPLTAIPTTVGTMARGRVARKVPTVTNLHPTTPAPPLRRSRLLPSGPLPCTEIRSGLRHLAREPLPVPQQLPIIATISAGNELWASPVSGERRGTPRNENETIGTPEREVQRRAGAISAARWQWHGRQRRLIDCLGWQMGAEG